LIVHYTPLDASQREQAMRTVKAVPRG